MSGTPVPDMQASVRHSRAQSPFRYNRDDNGADVSNGKSTIRHKIAAIFRHACPANEMSGTGVPDLLGYGTKVLHPWPH